MGIGMLLNAFNDFFGGVVNQLKVVVAILLIVGVILLCLYVKEIRPLVGILLSVFILIAGVFSTYWDIKFLSERNITIGDVINTALNKTDATKSDPDDGLIKWTINKLGFVYESDGIYTSIIDIPEKTDIDLKNNKFSLYINECKCFVNDISNNTLNAHYKYNFYDSQIPANLIMTDTLYVNFGFYNNKTTIILRTKGGTDAVKLWRAFQAKQNLILELKQSEEESDNILITDVEPIKEPINVKYIYKNGLIKYENVRNCFDKMQPAKGYNEASLISVEIPEGVTRINASAFKGFLLESIVLPQSLFEIDMSAFQNCVNLKNIIIRSGVTSISAGAFEGCTSLTNITIPLGVTSIEYKVFSGCTSLTNITIPSSVTSIDDRAFFNCTSLTKLTIPSNITRIGWYTFQDCTSLTDIIIPSGVTSIGNGIFMGCTSLTNITIPSSVISIEEKAFFKCTSLTKLTIPSNVTSIGLYAFTACISLTKLTIPSNVTKIGNAAFAACTSLTDITIPSSVTSIDISVFGNCTSLTNITIPLGVTSIAENSFYNCTSLTDITYLGTKAKWQGQNFNASFNLISYTVHCSDGDIIFNNK